MNLREHLVLYVDDEHANRVVFEQSFGKRFQIKTASSGPEALKIFASEPVAVAIVDQRMPEMSGHDLLVQLKEKYPDTIRLVMTAYSDVDPILDAINAGLVVRYMIKPWDRTQLDGTIKWALETYETGKQDSALQIRIIETERLVTLGTVAAAMLHDLRQPLASLLTNAERLSIVSRVVIQIRQLLEENNSITGTLRDKLVRLSDELPDLSEDLRQSCELMVDLTASMSRFMHPQSWDRAPEQSDPVAVIKHAVSLCRDLALQARGKLVYSGPPQLKQVKMGTTELSQVLINVISNAAHALIATARHGGKVTIDAAEENEFIRIVVSDDGVGMTPKQLERIGTQFFSTRVGGTGLGISNCHRLMGRVNGKIRFDSSVGVGTTVTLHVPRIPE